MRGALLALSLIACQGSPDACDLAAEYAGCDECYDGETTCTFEGITVTEASCGECQARGALYRELCDASSTADRATLEAMACTTAQ